MSDIAVISAPEGTPESLTVEEATAAMLASLKKPEKQPPAESAETATADPELADEANTAPDQGTTDEDQLDPDTQKFLADRDSEDQKAIKRALNEAADIRKASEAERTKAEQARQQYLSKLPSVDDIQRMVNNGPFSDIHNQDDESALLKSDPFRYLELKDYQAKMSRIAFEVREAEQGKAQEKQSKRANYEAQENARLIELVPEMANPKTASELRERAITMLTDDLGLKTDLLTRWMADDTGHEILSNAGIQKLIADGLKYRDIKSAPKAVVKADLPPVQRPGTAQPKGATDSARIQALRATFDRTGSLDDAFALRQAIERRRA